MPRRPRSLERDEAVPEWKGQLSRDDLDVARSLRGLAVTHRDNTNRVTTVDEIPREIGSVRRRPTHIGRPDTGQEGDAHAVAGRYWARRDRTAPPIMVAPDAQPAAKSREAVGGGSLLLDLPRHRRALPSAGAGSAVAGVACRGDRRRPRSGRPRPGRHRRARRHPIAQPHNAPSPHLLAAAGIFAALILFSSFWNGAAAAVAAGKLVEFAALTLGAAAFVDRLERLQTLIVVIVAFATLAVGWGAVGFVTADQGRQASFIGEHDLAAVATMALAVGLSRLHAARGNPGLIAVVGLLAGVVGVVLGASLASLLGVYAIATVILVIAVRRGDFRLPALLATLAVAAVATGGTLALRQGDLGFLQPGSGRRRRHPGSTPRVGAND